MQRTLLFLVFIIFISGPIKGQIKIGDNPQDIDPFSVLELESDSLVLVITQINTELMNAIDPSAGAIVYNTDLQCIHYYDGLEWVNLCSSLGISISADPITNINGISTIVITQTGGNYNLEVAENSIRTEQIVDGGINGDDIQDKSLLQEDIGPDAVGVNEIKDNAVGDSELIDGSITPDKLDITGRNMI